MKMSEKRDPISATGSDFKSEYFPVSETVGLNVLHWQPKIPAPKEPVIFVPGWISHVSGWKELLREMTMTRVVYYIETREKISARIQKEKITRVDFSLFRVAKDLITICKKLPVSTSSSVFIGSSFGATALLEAFKKKGLHGKCAFLIGPNSNFSANPFMQKLLFLPSTSYFLLKYFVIWYFRTFRVDTRNEPEQMRRYETTLKNAHPHRIKLSVKEAMNYQVWPDLGSVTLPTALACAPTDRLHSENRIRKMAKILPNAQIITCPSNKYMHSADLLNDIDSFIHRITGA